MVQGRNEEGTIPRASNHHEGANSLRGAPKRSTNVTSTFINTVLPNNLRFEHGAPNLLIVSGHHLTLLRPWHGVQNRG